MDAQEKFEYWLDAAQYDLGTAETLLASGRWTYVMVMCQQSIEKLVKGLYTLYVDDNVPRIHNIKTLVKRFEDRMSVTVPENRYNFFETLSMFYLNNRYPDFISKLGALINESEASSTLSQTKETFQWLLTLKP